MTNMSKLTRLSRIYTNNCIRGTYVAILDSLVDDYPLITTLVSQPAPQRYQPILPREPCDERPTMVSVNGKYRASSPEETVTSRCSDIQLGSSAFSAVQSREQAHLTKIIINSNHSQSLNLSSIRTSSSQGNSHAFNEKQTELKPSSPKEFSLLGMQYYSSQRGLQSPLAAYRLSHLQAPPSTLRSPLQSSFKTSEGNYSLPHTSSAGCAGFNYPGNTSSRVVYCQTAPAMASSSSHPLVRSSKVDRVTLIFHKIH